MLERPSSRLLILDAEDRLLLFKFEHRKGALAGKMFWATPGGGLEADETYEQAARRELREEVGLHVDDPGAQLARREVVFQLPTGETVLADERYFLIRIKDCQISKEGWSELEREVMVAHQWWSHAEVRSAHEKIWPENIADILVGAGAW